ncbi:MAG: hypothetical protein H0T49_04625 [Chloroflexia bacterium]|jgi:hypothetical protein|nr:hypothetical protein [Chloroflexia bacterium]
MIEAQQEAFDGLIGTYRELNNRVRPLREERLRLDSAEGKSVRDVVQRMRDDELRFSQALKERLTGVPMPEIFGDDAPVLGTESEDDSTVVLLSQFGTARESTLAMLRGVEGDDWTTAIEGGTTIAARIEALLANDRKRVEQINGLLGAP